MYRADRNCIQHADPRHSWKSWQHYYVKHADYFDHLIEQYQLEHSISIPPTVTNQIRKRYGFTEAEDALLVEHIAKNDLSGQRKGLSLYNVLSQVLPFVGTSHHIEKGLIFIF